MTARDRFVALQTAAQRAAAAALEVAIELRDTIATRNFRSGVPAHWIVESLTYDDATTRGALSTVPPVSYGSTEAYSREFARALSTSRGKGADSCL